MASSENNEKCWENYNTEDLIIEIEKWPAIWNPQTDEYSDKNAKRNAWENVIVRFVTNFNELSPAEKNNIGNLFKLKWKNLRDSYSREKAKQKKDSKSGSSAKFRKRYIFFNQLRFLETYTKSADDIILLSDDEEKQDDKTVTEERSDNPKNTSVKREGTKMRTRSDDIKFLEYLKAKYCLQDTEKDDDKLFLLSLHHDLQTLPDYIKLIVKSQIISVLASAKQVSSSPVNPQGLHQQLPPANSQNQTSILPIQQHMDYKRPSTIPSSHEDDKSPEIQQPRSYGPEVLSPDDTLSKVKSQAKEIQFLREKVAGISNFNNEDKNNIKIEELLTQLKEQHSQLLTEQIDRIRKDVYSELLQVSKEKMLTDVTTVSDSECYLLPECSVEASYDVDVKTEKEIQEKFLKDMAACSTDSESFLLPEGSNQSNFELYIKEENESRFMTNKTSPDQSKQDFTVPVTLGESRKRNFTELQGDDEDEEVICLSSEKENLQKRCVSSITETVVL